MAKKLYPPLIEGTIPAFCGTTLVVPFSLNRAVSKNEIAGFVIKIKTVQGSTLLGTIKQTDPDCFDLDSLMQVSFDVHTVPFTIGQFYKIQMAFIGVDGQPGYYSTVGVIKYTTMPKIEISGLVSGAINTHRYSYTGLYSQKDQDSSEKLYSSRFIIFTPEGKILKDSGEILHNIAFDNTADEAYEDFNVTIDLEQNKSYYIQFQVTTSNNLTLSTKKYRIMQKKSIIPDLKATLSANLCYDDGYVDLYLIGEKDSSGTEQIAIGSFVVCRSASNEGYAWNKVCEFSLQSQTPSRFLWRDYTVEHGVTYQYSVQQYNDYGLYSDRILSKPVVADFEDAFLSDGVRQLKIRYNPKVSSFKTDILESKSETIGSKHPFIFRNGNVYYKEFPISGLISYQMDNNHLFLSQEELGTKETSFDFTSDNLLAERIFKMEVLEWLNNGEEKLFRSPTEGNYIVRLMNNSLSPTDSLGRMLHTFNSTAYEVADFNYENLNKRGFITITDASTIQTRWATVEIAGHSDKLDSILANTRRYLNAGITVALTEEQYSRVLSYDYSLKKYFGQQTVISAYVLSSSTTLSQLNQIGTILGISAFMERTFSPAEYSRLKNYSESLAELLIPKTSGITYILSNTVKNNPQVLETLESIIGEVTYATGRLNTRPAYSIYALDMLPGTIIQLGIKTVGQPDRIEEIQIGATGSYRADFSEPVTSIIIPQKIVNDQIYTYGLQGSITYSYESASVNVFDLIRNIDIIDVPDRQWIGKQSKTYYDRELDKTVTTNDLIKIIENDKTDLMNIFSMRFEKRPLMDIFINGLTSIKGDENEGVLLKNLPKGVRLVEDSSMEALYAKDRDIKYIKYDKPVFQYNEETYQEEIIRYDSYYRRLKDGEKTESIIYVKVYDYFADIDCNQILGFDQLDPYYVYRICNARFDYTYSEVWYEKDFIDSNLRDEYYVPVKITEEEFNSGLYEYYTRGERVSDKITTQNKYQYYRATNYYPMNQYYILLHGYYVNKDGDKKPYETGLMLDGLSTNENRIIYTRDKYSNRVSINGDEIDLTETERYSIVNFNEPVTSLIFDNGIICYLSYQIRNIDYNLETSDNTVSSYKATYENYVSKLQALRMLASLEEDYKLQIQDVPIDSKEYILITEQFRLNQQSYASILGEDYNKGNFNYEVLQNKYIKGISSSYDAFIHQLTVALKEYKEANSIQ